MMTVAELLDLILDPEWNLPRTARVLVGTADGQHSWDVQDGHGRAGGPKPEVVLEIMLQPEHCPHTECAYCYTVEREVAG